MPRTPLAARVRILPCTQATRRRPLSVAVRNMTASGIVFIDSSYWMDGENFLLQLPHRQADPSRALLCTVTSWQPIATDLFVVSASFIRQVDSHPPTSYPKNRPECHS